MTRQVIPLLTAILLAACLAPPAASQAPTTSTPPREILPVAPGTVPGAHVARPLFEDLTHEHITVREKMTYGVAVGDVDRDGDLDIFHANFGTLGSGQAQANELWLNQRKQTGRAYFVKSAVGLPKGRISASRKARMGDLDGDGDLDLVVANSTVDLLGSADNQILINNGGGRFKDRTVRLPITARGGLTCAVALFDIDGDGDLDIFFGNYGARFQGGLNKLLRNDGRLRFVDISHRLPEDRLATVDAAFGDLDGNGTVDLVTAEVGADEGNRVYLNDGGGRFSAAAELPIAASASHGVVLGRFNRDPHLDLMIANLDGPDRLLFGNGRGGFRAAPALPPTDGPTTYLALGDTNADGFVDLVWVTKGQGYGDRLLTVNAGILRDVSEEGPKTVLSLSGFGPNASPKPTGIFRRFRGDGMPEQAYTHEAVFADLDGDNHLDVVTAAGQLDLGETSRVFMNVRTTDGAWDWFYHAKDNRLGVTSRAVVYYGQAVGDIDGDGDIDAVAAGRGARILINQDGFLADQVRHELDARQTHLLNIRGRPQSVPDLTGEALRLGDIDGDDDLDLVEVSWSLSSQTFVDRIHLNQGRGKFQRAGADRLPAPGHPHNADNLVLFDADGDGDLDLVTCNKYHPNNVHDARAVRNRLLLNNGRGFFTDATQTHLPRDSDGDGTLSAAAADLDGDGDLDLVYANGLNNISTPPPHYRGMRERVLINQGRAQGGREGVFRSLAGAIPGGPPDLNSEDLALADLDGDGDIDMAVANHGVNATPHLYFNRGDGRFETRPGALPDLGLGWHHIEVETGDLDLDGDIDLIFFNQHGENQIRGSVSAKRILGPSRRVLYLANNGDGRFTEWVHADHEHESYAGDAELLDVDGDQDLDLYIGAWDYKVSRLLINTTRGGFHPPDLQRLVTPIVNRETPLQVQLRGNYFRPGIGVRIRRRGKTQAIPANWVSESEVWFGLPQGLAQGVYDVWLRNPGSHPRDNFSRRLKLRVKRPPSQPWATRVEPPSLETGEKRWVTVKGSGLTPAHRASFLGSGLLILEQRWRNPSTLDLRVFVEPGAHPGRRHLVLVKSNRPDTLLHAVEITGGRQPILSTLSNNRLRRGGRTKVILRGQNLVPGAKIESSAPPGALTFEAIRYASPQRVEVHVTVAANAPPGHYRLKLTNPDGAVVEHSRALQITSDRPISLLRDM